MFSVDLYLSTVLALAPSSRDPPTASKDPSVGLGTEAPPALGWGSGGPGVHRRVRREKSSEERRGAGPKPPDTSTN